MVNINQQHLPLRWEFAHVQNIDIFKSKPWLIDPSPFSLRFNSRKNYILNATSIFVALISLLEVLF